MSRTNTLLTIFAILLATLPAFSQDYAGNGISVLLADDPAQCLNLEGLFIDGDSYVFIDGRNNTGRVKFIAADGAIQSTGVSTVPLPNAASLPGDILPSPFGLDRVVPTDDALWAVPAPWSGAIAEIFDRDSGAFRERLTYPMTPALGLAIGPESDVWAVMSRKLQNLSSPSVPPLDLSGAFAHIDNATGHPIGFVVLSQPDLTLVETSGVIRWRLDLNTLVNGFLSPMDVAAGPDGTIAVCAAICETADESILEDYFALRDECLARGDIEALHGVEDAVRTSFLMGFALILIDSDGTVADAIELSSAPVACAVDSNGRVHLMTQELSGWAISILDPRINEGIPQCVIPYGLPTLVSPHRLASGPDGSLYWDDLNPSTEEQVWGISRMFASNGVFSLGDAESGPRRVYEEFLTDSLRVTTALEIGPTGEIWVGCQDFLWDPEIDDSQEEPGFPYVSSILRVAGDGNLLQRIGPSEEFGPASVPSDLFAYDSGMLCVWAGAEDYSIFQNVAPESSWAPAYELPIGAPISNSRIGATQSGYLGWFTLPESDSEIMYWSRADENMNVWGGIDRLGTLGCRFLASDPGEDVVYVTIDDGEIFRLDGVALQVTGIWYNRLPSEAPGHPLNDAECLSSGLAILDREHRAILQLSPDAFEAPLTASEADITDALSAIRNALWEYKDSNGDYPSPSPSLLDDLLDVNELETVRRAFLGGRIYDYRPSETDYAFVAWSAGPYQPALACNLSQTSEVHW